VKFLNSTFLGSKEWSIYQNMKQELLNVKLHLLDQDNKESFFVNLYNLLALENFLKETENVLRIQNEDYSMDTILKSYISREGVFSLCDFTCQSPKFVFYSSKEMILSQEKKFIRENVIISSNNVVLPQCFRQWMEKDTSKNLLDYLKKFVNLPNHLDTKIFIFDPIYSVLNVFDQNVIYKNPNLKFFFEKDYGVEVTEMSQYFGDFKGLKKEGKGEVFEYDGIHNCEFLNDKKHGKGQIRKENFLINVEWEENVLISEFFKIKFRFQSNLQIELQENV
jgi:hypothetical protein